jgi:MFS family permease
MLIVGRVINGFAVGICSAQVPVYISEIAPPSKRGRLVGCQQWAITWGIMIMFYISYGASHAKGPAAFRIPWGIQATPAVILFFGLFILPESPRWLAKKNRWEESLAVLQLLHKKSDDALAKVLCSNRNTTMSRSRNYSGQICSIDSILVYGLKSGHS